MTFVPTPLFLFSLPRSGSTLCQRILASHKDISTTSEPHFLLHFFYSLKNYDIYSKYDHRAISMAIQDFCSNLPNGVNDYLTELRDFALRLYAKASHKMSKYFLDKSPKYTLIAEDIIRLFPESKFIIIWRNPFSVISSIMETWSNCRWNIYHLEFELFQGLHNLIYAYKKHTELIFSVRYEDLILEPEAIWKHIFDYLELPFDPKILTNFSGVKLKGIFRDPHSDLERYQVLTKEPIYRWKRYLANPLRKAWCRFYLRWIGKEGLDLMGYNIDDLMNELNTLPTNLSFLGSDICRMTYGAIYRAFELRIIQHKLQAWRAGNRIYAHK